VLIFIVDKEMDYIDEVVVDISGLFRHIFG
jgi:hypothetical protein